MTTGRLKLLVGVLSVAVVALAAALAVILVKLGDKDDELKARRSPVRYM